MLARLDAPIQELTDRCRRELSGAALKELNRLLEALHAHEL